jgi:hypothetical protein
MVGDAFGFLQARFEILQFVHLRHELRDPRLEMREGCADLAELVEFVRAPFCLRLLLGGMRLAHGRADRERGEHQRDHLDDHQGTYRASLDEAHTLLRNRSP